MLTEWVLKDEGSHSNPLLQQRTGGEEASPPEKLEKQQQQHRLPSVTVLQELAEARNKHDLIDSHTRRSYKDHIHTLQRALLLV